ncbi:MAG: bifunctional hydroxymethylpyrimidine kinase/phosphomethylpyrimidine kinase [Thermodesulfobacteriota bacterium]
MTNTSRAILSIAGSDPSGGAGIQADLKTFTSLGVYGCAAISCLTVQNTQGVYRVIPIDAELVEEQVRKVLEDLPVSHIKLGMLGNSAIARAVGDCLADFPGKVICDPVLKSSSGKDLLDQAAIEDLHSQVISRSSALTPNLSEFQALTGKNTTDRNELAAAANTLFSRHQKLEALILKGGHLNEQAPRVTDTLFYREGNDIKQEVSERPRVKTNNTHGTGCTYASALAAYHQKFGDWPQAFHLTSTYLDKLLTTSADQQMGHGTGPLHHHRYRNDK